MKTRGRRILSILFLVFFVVLPVAGLLARDPIASFVAKKVLAQRGMDCDEVSVHVPLKVPPSPVELGPTKCSVSSGPLQSVEFKETLYIHLPKFKLEKITCASIAIDLRARPHREVEHNTLGDLTKLVGADEPAIELMFDSAKLSEDDNPPVIATHAKITRAGKPIVEFHELHVTYTDEGMIVTSPQAHVDQAAILGDGVLRLVATPTAATVNVLFAKNLKVKVVLDHVDATKPKVDFNIALDSTKPVQQGEPVQ